MTSRRGISAQSPAFSRRLRYLGFIAAANWLGEGCSDCHAETGRSDAAEEFCYFGDRGANAAYVAVFKCTALFQVTNLDELLDTVELLTSAAYDAASGVALGDQFPRGAAIHSDVAADVGSFFSPLSSATIKAVETYLGSGNGGRPTRLITGDTGRGCSSPQY